MSRTPGTCMTMGSARRWPASWRRWAWRCPSMQRPPPSMHNVADSARERPIDRSNGPQRRALSKILTRSAFENAIRLLSAIAVPPTRVIHLLAFARPARDPARAGRVRSAVAEVPCWWICSLGKIPDEDLHYAWPPAVLKSCRPCSTTAPTRLGQPLGPASQRPNVTIAMSSGTRRACEQGVGYLVLKGNLCPNGAVVKRARQSVAVFSSWPRRCVRVDRRLADTNRRSRARRDRGTRYWCERLRAQGVSGNAEVGNMPLPRKLLSAGCETCCAFPMHA